MSNQINQKRLKGCLEIANEIINNTNLDNLIGLHPIYNYIKILLLNVQTEIIIQLGYKDEKEMNGLLHNFEKEFGCLQKPKWISEDRDISCVLFSELPSISTPWKTWRFINAFSTIGKEIGNGFVFDQRNHQSLLLNPIGVHLVKNGLHSSTSGIIKNEGSIKPYNFIDLSSCYNEFYFNGENYLDFENNDVIYRPIFKELGIIFEIGRLILESNKSSEILLSLKKRLNDNEPLLDEGEDC